MFKNKKWLILTFQIMILVFIVSIAGNLGLIQTAEAQPYWASLPPYNLLWPLWSPPLSPATGPIDPLTGLPTPVPIISELSNNTVLPVQPGIAWDPTNFPKGPIWLVYNIPPSYGGGLTFFDELYGFNPWPPPYLLDSAGVPAPIYLPLGYSTLLPTKLKHFGVTIDTANLTYAYLYGLTPPQFQTLLTPAELWGIPYLTATAIALGLI